MNNFQNIYASLSNIFCEPTTAITDFMLAGFCLWCYKIIVSYNRKREYRSNWALFFLATSASTFMGGVAHSIICNPNTKYHLAAWVMMQLFSGLALYFAQKAVFTSLVKTTPLKKVLQHFAFLQLVCYCICVVVFMDFKVVAFNSLLGLLQLLYICFPKSEYKWQYKTLITVGLLTSFITIYVNQTKLSFAFWFNHNDISHFIIFTSLLLIYKGITYKTELKYLLSSI